MTIVQKWNQPREIIGQPLRPIHLHSSRPQLPSSTNKTNSSTISHARKPQLQGDGHWGALAGRESDPKQDFEHLPGRDPGLTRGTNGTEKERLALTGMI